MTTWTRTIGLILAVVLVAGARGDEAKVSGDLKALQGAWVSAPGSDPSSRWEFNGESMRSTVNDTDYATKVVLEPKANPQPAIDFTVTDGPEELKGKTAKGIYKIDGEPLDDLRRAAGRRHAADGVQGGRGRIPPLRASAREKVTPVGVTRATSVLSVAPKIPAQGGPIVRPRSRPRHDGNGEHPAGPRDSLTFRCAETTDRPRSSGHSR